MSKHYTIEFKLQVLQSILNRKMSIRETARFYNIPSNTLVGTWLKRFEKSGIKGLIPRKPSGRPPVKPKYAKMPPPPKTEEERLRLRILQLEAEVAYLKELRRLRLQDEAEHKKVQRLMQALGLQVRSRKSKKFTTYRGTIGVIAPNHLERDFSATPRN